jgi:hypothetical protein
MAAHARALRMTAPNIVYLATADARGHLMRAQLLTGALRAKGASVQVLTTSDAGVEFFAGFGIEATLLSRHYAVQFDDRQNMRRAATDANVAGYVFRPSRMLRDIARLRQYARGADLIINDSFHPALLVMGCLPGWRRRVVHIYGSSLRIALETNFQGRLPAWLCALFRTTMALQIDAAYARLEHNFAYAEMVRGPRNCYQLPTPVALASPPPWRGAGARAAVYLNPHFRDPALADALEQALAAASLGSELVGEGFGERAGWKAREPRWIDHAASSDIIISAPGMAALAIAKVYRRPILLIVTDQPEQRQNAAQAGELGLPHRVVAWDGNALAFRSALTDACQQLLAAGAPGPQPGGADCAAARLHSWVSLLMALSRRTAPVHTQPAPACPASMPPID